MFNTTTRCLLFPVLSALLFGAAEACARGGEADAPVSAAPPAVGSALPEYGPASPLRSVDPLDFNLLEESPALTGANQSAQDAKQRQLDRLVHRRRGTLTAHQALGFATLGVMAITLVVGQLNYLDKFSGDDTGRYYDAHVGLSIVTTGLFASVGMLGVLAPNPYPKPIRADLALLHKVSMALATAGMLTLLILGPISAAREGQLDQRGIATAHLATGYATWALMATGTLAYVF